MGTPDSSHARVAATTIVRSLRDAGHIAYFAGGCVRDELLGFEPTDYDVATDATPDRIEALFANTHSVGAAFGVMLVRVESGAPVVEVATFRSDGPYSDRRRPDSITFSSPEDDARRRDFTINALFLDPLAAENAEDIHAHIIDYVNGLSDLKSGLVRAVGNADDRLHEDPLRAIRGVRFAARMAFRLEPETADAIARAAPHIHDTVSPERVGEELRKILTHPTRAQGIDLLQQVGLAPGIFSGTSIEHHEFTASEDHPVLSALPRDANFALALAAWMLEAGAGRDAALTRTDVRALRKTLMLKNIEREELLGALATLREIQSGWGEATIAARKRLAAGPWFEGALSLLRGLEPDGAAEIAREVEALRATPSGLTPVPLITGEDLLEAGLHAGPKFKDILQRVYDAQLEDRVSSREQAMELARSMRV